VSFWKFDFDMKIMGKSQKSISNAGKKRIPEIERASFGNWETLQFFQPGLRKWGKIIFASKSFDFLRGRWGSAPGQFGASLNICIESISDE
jgi:hypothetical protein